MEGLPVTFFDALNIDGKTATLCRRVCTSWKHNIDRVPRLRWYIHAHYVRVESLGEELNGALSPNKVEYVESGWFENELTHMLRIQNGFNMYNRAFASYEAGAVSCGILHSYGWKGEELSHLRDLETGDIMIVNNYYDKPIDCIERDRFDGMRTLESEYFPGTFTWRFIEFPFCSVPANHYFVGGRACARFHRGSCWQIVFKKMGEGGGDLKKLKCNGDGVSQLEDCMIQDLRERKQEKMKKKRNK